MAKRDSKDDFIKKAKLNHGDKYKLLRISYLDYDNIKNILNSHIT